MKRLFFVIIGLLLVTITLNGQIKYSITDFKPTDIRESRLYFRTGSSVYGDCNKDEYDYSGVPDSILGDYVSIFNKNDNTAVQFDVYLEYRIKRESKNNSFYSISYVNSNITNGKRVTESRDFNSNVIYDSYYESEGIYKQYDINLYSMNNFNHYFTKNIGISNELQFNIYVNYYKDEDKSNGIRNSEYYLTNIIKREDKYSSENKNNEKRNTINLKYYTGPIFGRLYEGQYSAIAMELVDELEKEKLLKKKPTNSQIEQLAKIIYAEKNRYYQDSREKRKKQLKTIIDFLVGNNIIEDSVLPILTIDDIYNYSSANFSTDNIINGISISNNAPNFNRPFGIYGGIKIGGGYNENNSLYEYIDLGDMRIVTLYDSLMTPVSIDTTTDEYDKRIDVRAYGDYNYSIKGFVTYGKPFGWHFHYISNLTFESIFYDEKNYKLLTYDDSEDYDSTLTRDISGESRLIRQNYGSYYNQFQYFLNSRTVLNFDQQLELYNKEYKFDERLNYNYYSLRSNIGVSGRYYITPSFYLFLGINYSYDKYFDRPYYIIDNDNIIKKYETSSSRDSWNIRFSTYFYL